jgi:hypothetical protein
MSFPPGTEMFQFPGFAPPAYGFSGRYPIAGVGCPIRRSPDRSLLAAPRGLTQRATSFIASRRQGIHQVPFSHSPRPSDNATMVPDRATGSEGGREDAAPGRSSLHPARWARAGRGRMHTHAGPRPPPPPERRGGDRSPPVSPAPGRSSRGAGLHIATIRFRRRQLEPPPPRRHGTAGPGPARAPGRGSRSLSPTAQRHRSGPGAPAPPRRGGRRRGCCWWARADLNGRPHAYQACALTS